MTNKDKNKRVSTDESSIDPVVGEVKGSKTSDSRKLELNLLTEMVNSNTLEVNIIVVNGLMQIII